MSIKMLTIGGNDYTTYALNLPFIDDNIPEWFQSELILNDILEIRFPLYNLANFDINNAYIDEVIYTVNDIIKFRGYISNVVYTNKDVVLKCKSNTSVLFNKHIRENEIMSPYIADEENPAVILKEMLQLIGLRMNVDNYNSQYNLFDRLGVTLSVTNENWTTIDLVNKLAQVTASRIYFYNDEFYYETYDESINHPFIPIQNRDWMDYPEIETIDLFRNEYRGTEVKFGANVSFILKNERIPEHTIDLSINYINGIYTDSAVTAQFVADRYDRYMSSPSYYLRGSIKMGLGNIINKTSYIGWDNRIYGFRNIKNQSEIKKDIECISLDYMVY